jgi:MFS family permease
MTTSWGLAQHSNSSRSMKNNWLKVTIPIAMIFGFRIMGLFMLVPIFTLYAKNLHDVSSIRMGIAIGIYGLAQGVLQIPFGMLSDKYGRKPIIAMGLGLFALGSFLGITSESIYGIIVARTLQGMGAIGSVLMALLADLTQSKDRVKSMAVIGASIGIAFTLAMILSPTIAHYYGLPGVFAVSSILAILGLILLYVFIPSPSKLEVSMHSDSFWSLLKNKKLFSLNFSIFAQHFILTATFFVTPMLVPNHDLLKFYTTLMGMAFVCMALLLRVVDKNLRLSLLCLSSSIAILQLFLNTNTYNIFALLLFAYFVAFNLLESLLPASVSKIVSATRRGAAMGIYSTWQFLGIFFGGLISGIVFHHYSFFGVFIFNSILAALWFIIVLLYADYHVKTAKS